MASRSPDRLLDAMEKRLLSMLYWTASVATAAWLDDDDDDITAADIWYSTWHHQLNNTHHGLSFASLFSSKTLALYKSLTYLLTEIRCWWMHRISWYTYNPTLKVWVSIQWSLEQGEFSQSMTYPHNNMSVTGTGNAHTEWNQFPAQGIRWLQIYHNSAPHPATVQVITIMLRTMAKHAHTEHFSCQLREQDHPDPQN